MLKKYSINLLSEVKKRKSLRDVLSLTGVQITLKPLQLAKSFVVAKYLGPEMYGILKSVELIEMLNKFGSLGFKPTIIRNASTEIAKGNLENVKNIKNNAYTGELILTFLLFTAGCISSLFFEESLVSVAIILASIGLFSAKMFGMVQTELQINKKFGSLGKVILFQGVFNSIFIILTVPFFNIYSVLIVPSVSAITVTNIALYSTGKFFQLKIDRPGFKKVLKVSMPLTIGTLAFGLFRYTERILIVSFLGLKAVGLFGFADTIVTMFVTLLLGSVLKVRGLTIFEELGKGNYKFVHKMVVKETRILVMISLGIIVCLAIGLNLLIPVFLPKWNDAILITIIFSVTIPLKLLNSYTPFVIKSPTINNLKFGPIIQVCATGVIVSGFFLLKYHSHLSLINFLYVDITAYAFISICSTIYYYKSFFISFVKCK